MFKKIIIGVIFLFLFVPVFSPPLVLADGMIMAPVGRQVFETDQKGAIFFENSEERLILSTSFKGDANDFAWIIPSPSKPEVKKSSAEIFTSLESLTGSSQTWEELPTASLGFGVQDSIKGVEVIEKKSIEYYDIVVLSSDDKNALSKWLNDNGYHFPEQYNYVLQSYIDNNWFFTAVKFKNDIDNQTLAGSMKSGNLIPLEFKFKTDKPVYPLKISSIVSDPTINTSNNNIDNNPIYVDGLVGRAIKLNDYQQITTQSQVFNIKEGSIELWIKAEDPNNFGNHLMINYASVYNDNGTKELSFGGNDDGKNMYFKFGDDIWFGGTSQPLYDAWSYVALTWKQGEEPKFYLNGKLLSRYSQTIPKIFTGTSTPTISSNSGHVIYIACDKSYSPRNQNRYIDEFKLSSKARSEEEIVANFNNGLGKKMTIDPYIVALSSFDNSLIYFIENGDQHGFKMLDYANKNIAVAPAPANQASYSGRKPFQVGIELYIFTPDKEQTLPGFTTTYAAWTDKKTIENLAMDDNGQPLIKLNKDKYYLTKITKEMAYEEMTNDLFFRDAAVNSDSGIEKPKTSFYILISVAGLISLIICAFIIKINKN